MNSKALCQFLKKINSCIVMFVFILLFGCSDDKNKQLLTYAGDGDLVRVEALLNDGADVNYKIFDTGTTPLIAAARKGHLAVAKRLLTAGADINAIDDGVGTALYWAAFEGRLEMVKFLLDNKGRLNCSKESAAYLLDTIRRKEYQAIESLIKAQLEQEISI